MWKYAALLLSATMMATGCVTVTAPPGRGAALGYSRNERMQGTKVAMASPAGMALHTVTNGAVQVDAFESLLLLAGLDSTHDLPLRGVPFTPQEAAQVLAVLLRKPVTLASFPARMAVSYLLREALEDGEVSREELPRRVERFNSVAVLRPDGYLAWTRNGSTQQKVGPVEWKDEAFRAGPFELGRFYIGNGWVFRPADAQLRPVMKGPPLAEVYDDADYINRTLDGAEESFVELYHATGQLLTRPLDSIAALQHLPAGVATLIASSPEYLERLRYMTRGEQVKALSKLTTTLLVTWGAASGTTRALTGALASAEATVPVLSLSADGLLVVERIVVPVGKVATVLSGGPGAAIILQRANVGGQEPSPTSGPGQWGPAEESMSARARAYQEQISGHMAEEAYWVGGVGKKSRGVKFDGFKDGVLLEAKGPGYANKFLDNLDPRRWFKNSGAQDLVAQARRQLGAARGVPIRWHIAEQKTADAIRKLLEDKGVFGIEVVYTPAL